MYTNGVMFERTTMNKVYKEECDCETRQKSGIFLDSIRPRKGHQKLSTAFQNSRNPDSESNIHDLSKFNKNRKSKIFKNGMFRFETL